MTRLRVALVGAGRSRQGLGPFVARDLVARGVELVAVAGRDEGRAVAACAELQRALGIEPVPYGDAARMLARETPHALCILSPADTHERYLQIAARAGVHVLCEKPLLWGGSSLAQRAARIVGVFRARGLLLDTLTQWPWVLDTFRKLHPDVPDAPPRRFGMRLSPLSEDRQGLGDALPHPLSVLQRLVPAPDARVEPKSFGPLDAAGGLRVCFDYAAGARRVDCTVELRSVPAPPRPAALWLDGRRGNRRIRLPDYRMELCDGERAVPMPDPLPARLDAWLSELRHVLAGGRASDPGPLAQRMRMLGTLLAAFDKSDLAA